MQKSPNLLGLWWVPAGGEGLGGDMTGALSLWTHFGAPHPSSGCSSGLGEQLEWGVLGTIAGVQGFCKASGIWCWASEDV